MSNPLDKLITIPAIVRKVYDGDENNKPNDHCFWGVILPISGECGWLETDKHLRERALKMKEDK